jgi:hypothetical protein
VSDEQAKSEDEVRVVKIDTDDLSDDQRRMLEAFGLDPLEGQVEDEDDLVFDSLDQLLECERHEGEGFWIDWPAVKGARVLLAHPESAGLAFPAKEREVRALGKVKDGDPTPAALIVKAAGLAAFKRTVKDWDLVLNGKPLEFNKINFLMMWRVRRFRDFVAGQAVRFRQNPQAISEQAGKA